MKDIASLLTSVREKSPLVHNITNFVVMNNTANALLATGASPIMSHAIEEVEDMVSICNSLVINIGTLDSAFVQAMKSAMKQARILNKPIVLDPVGAGATPYRNRVLQELLNTAAPDYIRGNASEIMALAGLSVQTKGVDSTESSMDSIQGAQKLSLQYDAVICVSGEIDIVVYRDQIMKIHNGHPMMTKVTGMGCSASAILAAFAAISSDKLQAAVAATAFIAICGELAAAKSTGPGSLQMNILDIMYKLTESEFSDNLRINAL